MGFGGKWRMWIRGCRNSAKASVLVNGNPTDEFSTSKGVRQGDPYSPFLFIAAMEGLSVAIKASCINGVFKGVQMPHGGPMITHLWYADDALFIGEWSEQNIKNLARVLRCFHVSSGLKVNFNKSNVYGIGAHTTEVACWARPLGSDPSTLPFNYLGVPVGGNMKLKKHWKPMVDRFHGKLSIWKAKSLSFGGRLTLIKSVMGNLSEYFLSLFVAPERVINTLEKIRRRFLWGGSEEQTKIHWVTWEKVIADKKLGGLGVGSLKALNTSLIVKWFWRLRVEQRALWAKVIKGTWKNITGAKKDLEKKGVSIDQVIKKNVQPHGVTWSCGLTTDGEFNVKALRVRLQTQEPVGIGKFLWVKQVPLKVTSFIWRARLGRILAVVELIKRAVMVDSNICQQCGNAEEKVDHIFLDFR
ncbi:uncharacterized protein LOC111877058 [Lactuca sativa]|uniref:uncharacterized protein LOC111877058 n=1 Tax=Lactuca sativa TaxID=4236 RepID=UPI000CD9E9DE|nr:uncharacterized protein LOC111877058 [Lactuca sativa]